ncbi:hypothetical protein J7E70_32030 [Variovorax paradoxus]|nr:hypothetical protein [Variovorax paradoxus]
MSRSMLSRIELGLVVPSIGALDRVALGAPITLLFWKRRR